LCFIRRKKQLKFGIQIYSGFRRALFLDCAQRDETFIIFKMKNNKKNVKTSLPFRFQDVRWGRARVYPEIWIRSTRYFVFCFPMKPLSAQPEKKKFSVRGLGGGRGSLESGNFTSPTPQQPQPTLFHLTQSECINPAKKITFSKGVVWEVGWEIDKNSNPPSKSEKRGIISL
jgi:hypothetical protein